MKCMSCNAEVPPQWTHSINTNTCPSCGSELMSNEELATLAEVRDAMNQMPNNPEGLAGWLLSNYKLVKVGDAEPTDFHQRIKSSDDIYSKDSTQMYKTSVLPPTPTNESAQLFQKFLQRTGVKMPDPTAMKKAAGTVAVIDYEDEEEGDVDSDEEISVEGIGNDFPDPVAATDPRESIRQKQQQARYAIASGSGKFSRS